MVAVFDADRRVQTVVGGSLPQPAAVPSPGDPDRSGGFRRPDAADTHDDARGAAQRLHPDGEREGVAEAHGDPLNAGTPIITAVGTAFIAVFGGSIIVERVLSIQGLGEWFFTAAFIRDLPVVQFLTIYTAFIVVLVNLVVDLSYGFIDPRVRYN
jgi:hypothetical protein